MVERFDLRSVCLPRWRRLIAAGHMRGEAMATGGLHDKDPALAWVE